MNNKIDIIFNDKSVLRVEMFENSLYTHLFSYYNDEIFSSIKNDETRYINEDGDVIYTDGRVDVWFIDKNEEIHSLLYLLELFNTFYKGENDLFTNCSTSDKIELTSLNINADSIPYLEVENIKNIKW